MTAHVIHLKSTDKAALLDFVDDYKLWLEPQEGRAAVPETTDEEGNVIPAQPAYGLVGTWYTTLLFNTPIEITIGSPVSFATDDADNIAQLCGVWA